MLCLCLQDSGGLALGVDFSLPVFLPRFFFYIRHKLVDFLFILMFPEFLRNTDLPLQLFFTDPVVNHDVFAAENISTLNDPARKLFLQCLDFGLPFFFKY